MLSNITDIEDKIIDRAADRASAIRQIHRGHEAVWWER